MQAGTSKQALLLAFTAWLAFSIAALLHVQHAYWAAMAVWVVAQPSRGLLFERAFFRVTGTLAGAGVGFALMSQPLHPYLQLGLLGVWIAVNAGLTHLLRGVHGYGPLLAGITAAIVVLPSISQPAGSIDIALARVQCTLIGVLVATIVLGLFTPRSPRHEFYAKVHSAAADAVRYAAQVLRQGATPEQDDDERRILREISELEAGARLALAGSIHGYRHLRELDALVVGSLALMATAQALYRERTALGRDAEDLARQLDQLATLLRAAPDQQADAPFQLIAASGTPALARLDQAVQRMTAAQAALRAPQGLPTHPLPRAQAARLRLAAPREWKLAISTGLVAGAATFAAAGAGYWLASPALALAALGVCIFSMVLGSMAQPQLVAPSLLTGVTAGVVVAIFYRLYIQPEITSSIGLILSMAPFLLLGGFARKHPRTAMPALDFNMCFLLASQAGDSHGASAAVILGDSLGLVLAAAVVCVGFILLPRRGELRAREASALIRRDVRRMIMWGPSDASGWQARTSRQILRLALRLGRAQALTQRWPKGMLATLNLGYWLDELHRDDSTTPDTQAKQARLDALAVLQRHAQHPVQAADALHRLADALPDSPTRQLLLNLATALPQAADLLDYSQRDGT